MQRGLTAIADYIKFPHALQRFDPLHDDAQCLMIERDLQLEVMPPWRDGGRQHWFVGGRMPPDGRLMRFGAETRNEATCRCAAYIGEQMLAQFAKEAA